MTTTWNNILRKDAEVCPVLGRTRRTWLAILLTLCCLLVWFNSHAQRTSTVERTAKKAHGGNNDVEEVELVPAPPPVDYDQLMDQECECRFPFIKTYNKVYDALVSAMVKEQQALNSNETLSETKARVFNPSDHITNDFVRRFLKFWHQEVTAMQPATNSSSSVPEARVLIIGDSIMRNLFHTLLSQMIHEGLAVSDEYDQMRGLYHVISLTWPDPSSPVPPNNDSIPRARLFIRYDYQTYFSSDNYDIRDSGADQFDPTHVWVDRGLWDVVYSRVRDPTLPLASFSAGLVKLRQRLLLNRMKKAMKGDTLRLPATRIVYFGMTKIYGPAEGAKFRSQEKRCTLGKDVGPFRDALYCAVRRANGALASIHKRGADVVCQEMVRVARGGENIQEALRVCQEHVANFSNLAIEFLDAYAPSLAGSLSRTSDGYHPDAPLNLYMLESLFNQSQRAGISFPEAKASITKLIDICSSSNDVVCAKALGEGIQLYVPPPLQVQPLAVHSATNESSVCLLAMSPSDIAKLWNSSFGSAVEPPSLVSPSQQLWRVQHASQSHVHCPLSLEGRDMFFHASRVVERATKFPRGALSWRSDFYNCLSLSMLWYLDYGSLAHWSPATVRDRQENGAFGRLTNIKLGISPPKRDVVHAAGKICMQQFSQLTTDDFSEIWDMGLNGTLSCHRASTASVVVRPPGAPHFLVTLKTAAECQNNEAKRDEAEASSMKSSPLGLIPWTR